MEGTPTLVPVASVSGTSGLNHPHKHTSHVPRGTWSNTGSVGQENVWVFALNLPSTGSEAERVKDGGEALLFTTPALGIGTNYKAV